MDIQERIAEASNRHKLELGGADVHVFGSEIYLCSEKAAAMVHSSFHSFSNHYVPLITANNQVRCMRLGRNRWYSLTDLEKLVQKAIDNKMTIFEACKVGASGAVIKKKQKK